MQKYISTKEMYNNFKTVGDEVMQNGTTFVVLKYSRPAYKIVPLKKENGQQYSAKDIHNFTFSSKNKKEKSLATNYKKYLYQA